MAVSCAYMLPCTKSPISLSPFLPPSSSPTLRFFRNRIPCSKSPLMEPLHSESHTKFMEFPYVSAPHRDLMVQLVSSVETRLESALQPCTLPPDVQYYQNPTGSAHASLHVRSGLPSSRIDFILGSWVHCKLPTGGALNITSLSAYLRPSTDAPNFLIELIRSSPVSLILILDLSPRKDLVLHPEYLKEFYEDTQLDRHRQLLEKLPEVRSYVSSSLYIRSVVSPCAVMVSIEAPADQTSRIDEIIRDHISPIAKEMLETWLDMCACVEREVGGDESAVLGRRDQIIKNKTIEIDLGSSFPRLFGEEVANRVLGVLRDIYNA
nr:red chlorophyll catabolite reductase, chloroplastic [Ipomoea batatas]